MSFTARNSSRGFRPQLLARLRLATYFSVVFIALAALSARALYARGSEAALALGHELGELSDLIGEREALVVNGTRFRHAIAHSDQSLDDLLDRLQAHCEQHGGSLQQALSALQRSDPKAFAAKAPAGFKTGVIRERTGDRGVLICFTDPERSPLTEAAPALALLTRALELRNVGDFQYSFLERSESGKIRVVTLWTAGGIDFEAMFPEGGDAAGQDSSVVPRPPAARRTLSAGAETLPFGVRVYESSQPAAELERFYAEYARSRNWQRAAAIPEDGGVAYLREDGLQIFVSTTEVDGRTYVTLTETGAGANAAASVSVQRGATP